MAMEEAKRFLEEFKANGDLGKTIRSIAREDGESIMAFYARTAKDQGFDFDVAELEAAYADLGDDVRSSLESVELDDAELDQMSVAGGWCWFDDECSKIISYVKVNPNCFYTYGGHDENCFTNDRCNTASNEYSCTDVVGREEHGNGH